MGSSSCHSGHHIDTSGEARYICAHNPYISGILISQPALQGVVWAAMETTGMSAEITSKDAATSKVINQVEPDRFLLHLRPVIELTDDQLFELCQINQELWIERTAEGDLVIMAPEGWETGIRGANLVTLLTQWAWQDGTGVTTGSSVGYFLPNGAMRAPDIAWVLRSRLAPLSPEQKQKFLPLCPDFVVEIRSPCDRLSTLQAKMQEYLDNGARLGWLIDAANRAVYVYRPKQLVKRLDHPTTISGEPVLPGFVIDLQTIWELGF
jgi:Uma2 family endonuclease